MPLPCSPTDENREGEKSYRSWKKNTPDDHSDRSETRNARICADATTHTSWHSLWNQVTLSISGYPKPSPPSFSDGHKKEGDKVLMSAKIEDPWPDGRRGGRLERGEGSDVRWFALQGLQASAVIFYQRMLFKPPPTPSFRLPRTKGGMRLINISSAVSRDEELIQI